MTLMITNISQGYDHYHDNNYSDDDHQHDNDYEDHQDLTGLVQFVGGQTMVSHTTFPR